MHDKHPANKCTPVITGGVFDPFGFSRGDADLLRKYKENEIKNGRLAMVLPSAFLLPVPRDEFADLNVTGCVTTKRRG